MTADRSVRPPVVAIVGAGPAGFYAAEALLRADPSAQVDVIDRLPTPFGLVRSGVAPDHQKIKAVVRAYDRIAAMPGFRFIGDVHVGTEPTVDELLSRYDHVILATGAARSRSLQIPGSEWFLPASSVVAWYNSHPDLAGFQLPLHQEQAAIIGMGNVALDVARVLVGGPERLEATDVSAATLNALRNSRLSKVHIVARRGPDEAAFTAPELAALTAIEGLTVRLAEPFWLPEERESWLAEHAPRAQRRLLELVRALPTESTTPREVVLHFRVTPLHHDDDGLHLGVNTLSYEDPERSSVHTTAQRQVVDAPTVIVAAGYATEPLPGVPFDARTHRFVNDQGRTSIDGLWVVGWAKRGPTGVIGTNRADAKETVAALLEVDRRLASPRPLERGTSWSDWTRIDESELATGAELGKVRHKHSTWNTLREAAIDDEA